MMLRQRCGLWIAGTSTWSGANPSAESPPSSVSQSTSRNSVAGRIGQTLSITGPPSAPPPPSTATALLVNVSFFDRMMDLSFAHIVENCTTTAMPSSNCTMPQNLLSRSLGALLVEETSRGVSYWDPTWNRELRNVGIIAPIVAVADAGLFDPMTMVGAHGPHNSSSSALGDSDHHAFPAEVIAVLVLVPVIGLAVLLLVIAYVWCYKAGKCGEWCGILSRSSTSNEVVVSRRSSNGLSSASTAAAAAAAASRRSMRRGSDSKGSAASSTMPDGKNTGTTTAANRRSTGLGFLARLTSCCGGGPGEDATAVVGNNNNRATAASDPNEDVEIEVTAGGASSISGKYAVNNNRSTSNEKRGDRQVLKWAELDQAGDDADDIERQQHRLSNSLDHSSRSPRPPAASRHHLQQQQGPPSSMNASLLLHPGDSWQRERSPSSPLIRLHQTDSPPPPPTLACSVRSPNRGSRASGFFDGRADGAPSASSSRQPSQHDLLRQPSSSATERRSSPSFRMQSFLREGVPPAPTLDSHLHMSHSLHHHQHHHYHQEGMMTDGPHRLSSSGSPLTTRQGGEDDGERRGGGEGWKALSRTTMATSRLSALSPKRGGLSPAKRRALHEMTD